MKQLIVCCLLLFSACRPSPDKSTKQQPQKNGVGQQTAAQYEKNPKTIVMMKEDKKAFACKLSSPELQKKKNTVIAQLKSIIVEKVELTNGFSYKFKNTDAYSFCTEIPVAI